MAKTKISKEEIERVKIKIRQYKKLVREESKKHYGKMYLYLSKLLKYNRKINPKYTVRRLALDLELHEGNVYRILSWSLATPYIEKMVKSNQITKGRVLRVLHRCKSGDQDEIIKNIIKYRLKNSDIDDYITKKGWDKKVLKERTEFINSHNIARSIRNNIAQLGNGLSHVHTITGLETCKALLVDCERVMVWMPQCISVLKEKIKNYEECDLKNKDVSKIGEKIEIMVKT